MNSAMDSTSGSTTLKVRTQYFLFSNEMKFLHCVLPPLSTQTQKSKGTFSSLVTMNQSLIGAMKQLR